MEVEEEYVEEEDLLLDPESLPQTLTEASHSFDPRHRGGEHQGGGATPDHRPLSTSRYVSSSDEAHPAADVMWSTVGGASPPLLPGSGGSAVSDRKCLHRRKHSEE